MKILLVEDNGTIIKGLTYLLTKNGYEVVSKSKVIDVKNYLLNDHNFNLIILDITLPDGDGFKLYDSIKNYKIPTIFLTAKDSEEDIVSGLNMGAEDYITKPFSSNVLLAKINKIVNKNKENIIKIDNIIYDLDKMVLYKDSNIIELTSLELKIVNLLFANINKVVSRTLILDSIWDWTGNDVDDHTITVYFKRIKDKIGKDIIKTVKGIGYRIDEK